MRAEYITPTSHVAALLALCSELCETYAEDNFEKRIRKYVTKLKPYDIRTAYDTLCSAIIFSGLMGVVQMYATDTRESCTKHSETDRLNKYNDDDERRRRRETCELLSSINSKTQKIVTSEKQKSVYGCDKTSEVHPRLVRPYPSFPASPVPLRRENARLSF